LVGRRR
jgi:hypothetical protein